jgi:quinol monooxygenase YgiN
MFHREWKCTCPKAFEQGFITYLGETGVKDTQMIEGCVGYHILRRALGQEVEITFVSLWKSLDHMKAYAGDDLYKAVLYPEDEKYHIHAETEVKVYEVLS